MLHELRITARGGGARDIAARFANNTVGGAFQTDVGSAGQAIIILPREEQPTGRGPGTGGGRGGAAPEGAGGGAAPEGGRGRLTADVFGKHELELLRPAPFMRPLEAQQIGRVWEFRWLDFPEGTIDQAVEAYAKAMPHREEYYPVVGCWTVEAGARLDRLYLLSPFKDWDHRDETMAKLRNDPAWPPETAVQPISGGAWVLTPAPYSPLR